MKKRLVSFIRCSKVAHAQYGNSDVLFIPTIFYLHKLENLRFLKKIFRVVHHECSINHEQPMKFKVWWFTENHPLSVFIGSNRMWNMISFWHCAGSSAPQEFCCYTIYVCVYVKEAVIIWLRLLQWVQQGRYAVLKWSLHVISCLHMFSVPSEDEGSL